MAGLEGMRFGDYVIIQHIGSGRLGDVYLGEQERLRRQVAIKTLRESGLPNSSPDAREHATQRFSQEARAVARLEHPHLVRLYDFGQAGDFIYLVMAYVPGGSLTDLVRPNRATGQPAQFVLPLSPALVAQIVEQTADALQYAHDQGLIHGDVKPQNLLTRRITPEQQAAPDGTANPALAHIVAEPSLYVLLTDFGLAGFLVEMSGTTGASGAALYTAPEQAQGRPIPASDQYALACVAYELLTGQPVFNGAVAELDHHHRASVPLAPTQVNPILPRGVDGPFLRALAKDPVQRFPRVADFAQALTLELVGVAQMAAPASTPLPAPSLPWQTPAPFSTPLVSPGAAFAANSPNTTPTPPFGMSGAYGTYGPPSGNYGYGTYGPAGSAGPTPPYQPAEPLPAMSSPAWPVTVPAPSGVEWRTPDGAPTPLAAGAVPPTGGSAPVASRRPGAMSRRTLLLTAGGVGVAGVACAGLLTLGGAYALHRFGPQAKATPKTTPKPAHYSVHVRWRFAAGHNMYSSPLLANGLVYFGADTSYFYALDATTGKVRWRSLSKAPNFADPLLMGETIYTASTDGILYARKAATGAHVWFTNVRNPIGVTPATDGTHVYCCTYNGNSVALDSATGGRVWTHITGYGKLAAPAVANGVVIVAGDGGVAAISATDGHPIWRFTPNHTPQRFSRPLVSNGTVYVGGYDGVVYALGLHDGSYKWAYRTSGPILDAPAIQLPTSANPKTILYVGSQSRNISALDAITGKRLWIAATQDSVARTPTVADGTVYVGSHDTILYAFDAQTGQTLWAYHLGGAIDTSPAVANGTVYSGCDNGIFYAIAVTSN
ncbi:MAG: PQQ-binding-like beta-propeller repeat protein [Ktedonobacterales bacterium]